MNAFNIPANYDIAIPGSIGLQPVITTFDQEWTRFCTVLANIDINAPMWPLAGHQFEIFCIPCVVLLKSYYDIMNSNEFCPLNPAKRVFHFEGQSGTGKSTMLVVIAKHCMRLNRPFVYSIDNQYYYWSPNQNGKINEQSEAFNDVGVTWLMDQAQCGPYAVAHCRIVLVTSPNEDHYGKFIKRFGTILESIFMPLPTPAECQAVVATYTHVNDFQDRFVAYGPILRVLCSASLRHHEMAMETALRVSDYSAEFIDMAVHTSASLKRLVFHQSADQNFMPTRPTFGTRYLADCYLCNWKKAGMTSLQRFLSNPSSLNFVEHGVCFEMYAHDCICKNLQVFRGRKLHGLNESANIALGTPIRRSAMTNLPGFAQRVEVILSTNNPVFATVNQPAGPNGMYLRPKYTNFGAVDAVIINPGVPGVVADLFQMTTNLSHGINSAMLAALMTRIDAMNPGAGGNFRLFIVMPMAKAESLMKQQYLHTAGQTVFLTPAQLDRIEQYSLAVDTSPSGV